MLGPQMVACSTPATARIRSSSCSPARARAAGVRIAILRQLQAHGQETIGSEQQIGARQRREALQHQQRACGEHERRGDLHAGQPSRRSRWPRDPARADRIADTGRHRAPDRRQAEQQSARERRQQRHQRGPWHRLPTAANAGTSMPLSRTSSGVSHAAIARPASAPSQRRAPGSRRSAAARRGAIDAPIACRTANSRDRSAERTSSRFATFAQPISSTKIDPPSRNQSGRRASAKYCAIAAAPDAA